MEFFPPSINAIFTIDFFFDFIERTIPDSFTIGSQWLSKIKTFPFPKFGVRSKK